MIAVSPQFQRKGLGALLISDIRAYAHDNNIKEIFVAAHKEDKHALDFYTSVHGQAKEVVHFTFSG